MHMAKKVVYNLVCGIQKYLHIRFFYVYDSLIKRTEKTKEVRDSTERETLI